MMSVTKHGERGRWWRNAEKKRERKEEKFYWGRAGDIAPLYPTLVNLIRETVLNHLANILTLFSGSDHVTAIVAPKEPLQHTI
jgi:hypothetical protein